MSDSIMKRCTKCKLEFPATHEYFTQDPQKSDGLYSSCRNCYKVPAHREILPDGFKRCTKCQGVKPFEEFSSLKRGGFDSWCKECRCFAAKMSYTPNPRVKLPPEEKKRRKQESDRLYAAQKKDERKAYQKEYYRQNDTAAKERTREWRENNPERARINNKIKKAKRRVIEVGAPGSHTAEDIHKLYEEQAGRCAYCGITLHGVFHLDHVTPISLGGSNNPDNLACACAFCNLSKGDKLLDEWMRDRGW